MFSPIRSTSSFFFFNDTATTEIYTVSDTLSLHDALPISAWQPRVRLVDQPPHVPRQRSEEHTSELQSPDTISYAVFCLKKKKKEQKKRYLLFLLYARLQKVVASND